MDGWLGIGKPCSAKAGDPGAGHRLTAPRRLPVQPNVLGWQWFRAGPGTGRSAWVAGSGGTFGA